MKLGKLICNKEFDVNCKFKIYFGQYGFGGKCVYDSNNPNGIWPIPLKLLYDYEVSYITIETKSNSLIIEVKEAE